MLKVRCQANATVDDKGRLALPVPLRRALVEGGFDRLVLSFHQGAVWGWTPDVFEATVEKPITDRDPFDIDVIAFTRAILGPAQDVEIDGQGRIRVPPPLRARAKLDRDVVVMSMADRIELWDAASWEASFEQSLMRTGARSGMPGRTP